MRTVLKGAVVYKDGSFVRADLAVEGGVITLVEEQITPESSDEVVDVAGCHILPGLVDVHVHLREPGLSHKETIATGTAAAAHGGYTTVCSMPNVSPAPCTREALDQQLQIIERDARVRVIPCGCITMKQDGAELVDFGSLSSDVVGFSDDGRGVQSQELMFEAMKRAAQVDKPIIAHCEDESLLNRGYIHDGEYCRQNGHRGICSESEWGQVKRDLELVEKAGCQYHVCHISTKETVELVREAKAKGLRVSCETAPHYLLMTDADLREEGRFKMNPPIRSAEDRAALIEGIKDGTIELIATDHAPHTAEEKSRGLERSAMGVVGLESAFGLLYKHLVTAGVISLEKLVELMSVNPRRIFSLGGALAEGQRADLVVMQLDKEFEVRPEEFLSMGRATPFEGWAAQGATRLTMVDGSFVYDSEKK